MTGYGGADRNYFWGSGPPPYSEREINPDFEAGTLINKAAVNLTLPQDTIDAQVLRGMPYGRNPSEPSKPTLEFPFMQLRTAKKALTEGKNDAYNELIAKLKGLLPQDVRENLHQSNDPSYIALNKTLSYIASMLLWMEQMSQPFEENTAARRFAEQNLYLTERAMEHLMKQGQRIIKEGVLYLDALGRGHISYDALFNFLRQIAQTIKLLKSSSTKHEKHREDDREKEENEQEERQRNQDQSELDTIKKVSAFTEALNKEYLNKKNKKQFQMIGALIWGIDSLNKSNMLTPALRSLLYGLITINIGNDRSESALGFLGQETKKIINNFNEIIVKGFFYEINVAEQILIPHLITTLTSLCLIASAALIHSEETFEPVTVDNFLSESKTDPMQENRETINASILENFITMACALDPFSFFIDLNKIHPVLRINNGYQAVSKSIELLLLLSILRAIHSHQAELADNLVSNLSDLLIERIKIFESALFRIKAESDNPKYILDVVQKISICRHHLETRNFLEYNQALTLFFASLGANTEFLDTEFRQFFDLTQIYVSLFTGDLTHFNDALTGIVQI